MPVAAREAAVHIDIAVAKHFRNQDKAVALIAGSMLPLSKASR